MNRIETTELMEMLKEGKTQTECAAHFEVSPSAISQSVQKIRLQTPSEAFLRLSEKERCFVLAKSEGKNNMEAVKSSFDVTTDQSAKSFATQLMKDPDVRLALSDLMAQEGIPRRRRIQRLRDMVESKDMTACGKALDMSFKLDGSYAPEQIEVVSYDPVAMRARYQELETMLAAAMALSNDASVIDVGTNTENKD